MANQANDQGKRAKDAADAAERDKGRASAAATKAEEHRDAAATASQQAHDTTIDKKPNTYNVTHEFLKTTITLASALLAFSVTFLTNVVTDTTVSIDNIDRGVLTASWVLLFLSALCSVIAIGLLINYLRFGKHETGMVDVANASFYILCGGVLCLGVFGVKKLWQPAHQVDAVYAVMKAREFLAATEMQDSNAVMFKSLSLLEGQDRYILSFQGASGEIRVTIDSEKGAILKRE